MRPHRQSCIPAAGSISIHASREGCDVMQVLKHKASGQISIHASREGCDQGRDQAGLQRLYFNPRIPRGMRPGQLDKETPVDQISIHASREGCDRRPSIRQWASKHFNPRIPRGMRRTIQSLSDSMTGYFNPRIPRGMRPLGDRNDHVPGGISIHASREGCDSFPFPFSLLLLNFNPRIPRGMRRR